MTDIQKLWRKSITKLQNLHVPQLSQEHIQQLNHPFTEEEVTEAVFQIGRTKASEIDGKPSVFYQKFWHIVSKDTATVLF